MSSCASGENAPGGRLRARLSRSIASSARPSASALRASATIAAPSRSRAGSVAREGADGFGSGATAGFAGAAGEAPFAAKQCAVGSDLSILTGGDYVNRFNIQGRSYKVIPQAKRTDRLNPEQLSDFYVSGPEGKLVQLSTFATLVNSVQPRQLNRFQQLNSAKIQGAVVPGVSIDQALKILEDAAAEILPAGYTIDYAGESRQLRKEESSMLTTLLLALLLIFLVLAAQFESFRDPLIILAGSVPLALAGALAFVFLDATTLNIYSQVGLVTLVGLIAKNGILIVEFANHLQERGHAKYEAVVEAASTRLRPVLMTSVATVFGHFPLILASGAGAGARNSIGIVLVSGMIVGTLFTLFMVPAIYTFIAKEKNAQHRRQPASDAPFADQPRQAFAM